MAVPKLKLESPLYVAVSEGGRKIFEKSFTHAPITIGRSLSCDVPLAQYNWISRQHFQVVNVEGRWVATDLNSSSGITVQGERLSQVELKANTRLDVGPLSFSFNFESQPTAPTVKSPSATKTAPRPASRVTSTGNELAMQTETVYDAPYPKSNGAVPQPKPKPSLVPPIPGIQTPPPASIASPAPLKVPKASHQAQKPVNFREPNKTKLGSSWFQKTLKKSHGFVGKPTGVDAIKLNSLVSEVEKVHPARLAVEVYITWKGQLYDSKLYFTGEQISVGTHQEDIYAPTLKGSFIIGRYDGRQVDFFLNKGARGSVVRANKQSFSLEQLIQSEALPRRGKNTILSLKIDERCEIEFGAGLKLHTRFVPAPRQLSKSLMREPDQMLKKAMTLSGSVHLAFLLLALLLAPTREITKVKNLPDRVARLLIPKTPPPEKKVEPPPAPEPPKVAKEEPTKVPPKKKIVEKKRPPVPKKVVIKTNEKLKVINKLPPAKVQSERVVEGPKIKEPPPDLNSLGALAALGAIGNPTPNPKNQAVAININPNAGGQVGTSTSGMIGTLKSKNGQLAAGGATGVKTTGKGFGTGTGYGVQGLKGTAGQRGVGGAVIGTPKLMDIAKNEGLSQKQVMEVVKKYVGRIQQCYERALLAAPSLAGRVEYEWEISPQGSVKRAMVKRSDVSDGDTLNTCVTGVIKEMKFPVASNGQSTTPSIGFPFGRL